MCGIAVDTSRNHRENVKVMLDAIPHRGPDDRGIISDSRAGVTLGMNRLSIIDVSEGRQPLCNEDHSVFVVCNGEIFNSPNLRKELEGHGHRFSTVNSDIEVIPHLYEEYGFQLVDHLDGMFAFVLYDSDRQLLFAARDRFGIKPLYYSVANGNLALASELKSILRMPGINKCLDRQSISNYLSFQFLPAPRTPYEQINKIRPGHCLRFDLKSRQSRIDRYWRVKIEHRSYASSNALEDLREHLRSAVKQWSLSDVPIAVSLSGGVDSAAIVGLMANSSNGRVRTYTLGFRDSINEDIDELVAARITSKRWQTDHTEIIVDPDDVIADLPKMAFHLDEPYGGGLPSWFVYRAMSGKVKVCHTGTGADELFGNYAKAQYYHGLSRGALWRETKRSIKTLSVTGLNYLRRFPNAYGAWMFIRENEKREIFFRDTDTLYGCDASEELFETHFQKHSALSTEDTIALFDFENQLAEEFLHVTDRFSMAHSIEARVPFLDHHLVERVMQVPAAIRVTKPNPKQYFKEIVAPFVCPEILQAKKKGFVLPLARWTRNELRPTIEEYFSPAFLKKQGLFSPALHKELLTPHLEGRVDFTEKIWTYFMFQKWYQVFVG
jgi:asparagine synthase (glutamine-hydrolysing)